MKPIALPHQDEAFYKLSPLQFAALFAEMGTGKSRILIDLIEHKVNLHGTNRAVIIAPSVVANQWVTEQLPEHCDVHYNAHTYQAKKTQAYVRKLDGFIMSAKHSQDLHILCIHFEAMLTKRGEETVMSFLNSASTPPVIAVDESSRIKNPDAKYVRKISSLRQTYPNSFRYILSGTPASKSPVDLWSQFDFLTPNFFNCNYVTFKAIHTVRMYQKLKIKGRLMSIETTIDKHTYDRIKKLIEDNTKDGKMHPDLPQIVQAKFSIGENDFWFVYNSKQFTRFKNMDKLQDKIAPITYAVKRADCVDLPEKIYQQIFCDLNPEQKKLIKELTQYSATVYGDDMLTVDIKALLGLRVMQICGGNFSHLTDLEGKFDTKPIKGINHKIKYLVGDVPEIGDQQFVVCAVYTPEILAIGKELAKITDVGLLYGDTTENIRKETVADFKAGHLQGLIMNPAVGGFGLNLQNATVQYWYSRNYRTELRLQTEDRQHRIGTTKSPIYKDLISKVDFEYKILESLKEGKSINDVFVNNSINKLFKV